MESVVMKKTARRGVVPIWMVLLALSCGPVSDEDASTGSEAAMEADPGLAAAAILHPTEGNATEGIVAFEEMGGGIHVMAHVTGLEPGRYGLHVHEMGDCSSGDGTSAGAIFDPEGSGSGTPAGQLGEIEADESGMAHFMTDVQQIALSEGPRSVVGRSIVIMTVGGEAITSLACGVIEPQAPGAMREGSGY
jgi:Cu-Zn family superoxide dismutase